MDSYHVIILSNPYLSAHVARSWCVPVHSPFREDGHARERATRADNPSTIHTRSMLIFIKFNRDVYTTPTHAQRSLVGAYMTYVATILNLI